MDKKLKVLQVNKLYYPYIGGVETVVQQLAEGLNDLTDMKVLVCQPKGRGTVEYINRVEVHKAGSLGVFFSMPLSVSFFRQLRILSQDRDVVHFHMPFPLGDLAYFLSGYKGKVVVWWHSDIVRQKSLMLMYKPLMRRFLKRVDAIIVATPGHIKGSSYLGEFEDKCVIIPYGLDEEYFNVADELSQQKQRLDDSNRPVELLFVGRLVYYKGCDVLIKAFRQVSGARLTIIGEGQLKPELQRLAQEFGVAGNIVFKGAVDEAELKSSFAECDIFILPSVLRSEAFGLVQMEAMAYGKPVINTSLESGVPYVSIHEETGLTVPPGNIETLAGAMQSLIDDKSLRKALGEKARRRVEEHYSMKQVLKQIMEVYR